MSELDDFISLRNFAKDESAIFDILEAGMKGKISIYVHSSFETGLIQLSPEQLNRIRSNHPNKTGIKVGEKILTTNNRWMGTISHQTIPQNQPVVFSDLWVQKNEIDLLFKPAIHTPIKETERNSMLKLILGMAVAAYDYDPRAPRNAATGSNKNSIKSDLEKLGLKIDEGTIVKYLEEAKRAHYHALILQP